MVVADQPFNVVSVGDSEDGDLIPLQSGEDWIAQLADDLSRPASQSGEAFSITALQLKDPTCVTLLEWIRSDTSPPWMEVKSLCPEVRFLWHHTNNLSVDANGVLWRKRSITTSATSTNTWKRVIVLGLSCFLNWRSFGPESHLNPIEPAVLLVGNG